MQTMMNRIYLVICFLFTLSIITEAQERYPIGPKEEKKTSEEVKRLEEEKRYREDIYINRATLHFSEPFVTLDNATGWNFCTEIGEIWIGKNKKIEDFDTFDQWQLGIATLSSSKKKYLYLRKIYSRKDYFPEYKNMHNTERGAYTYLVGLDDYINKLQGITDTDNLISLDLIAVTDNEDTYPFLLIIGDDPYWKGQRKKLIKEHTKSISEVVDKGSNVNDGVNFHAREIAIIERRFAPAKLAIKFRLDREKNWARFLIYSYENTYVYPQSFQYSYEQQVVMSDALMELIQSDDLWTSFYYETDLDYFVNFVKAPLGVLE